MEIMGNDKLIDFGGKAYWLSCLKKFFNVPDFFVIRFIDNEELESCESRILTLCDTLSTDLFAIRSSASCEDMRNTSFAGMFSSCIGVPKNEVMNALKKVVASKSSKKVKAYAELKGINVENIMMNVIIQKYIKATFSGVCFFRNKNVTIEFVKGGCAKLVDGTVSPETVYARHLKSEDKYFFEKSSEMKYDKLVKSILEILVKIQIVTELNSFDVEWACDENSELYILQARPLVRA